MIIIKSSWFGIASSLCCATLASNIFFKCILSLFKRILITIYGWKPLNKRHSLDAMPNVGKALTSL